MRTVLNAFDHIDLDDEGQTLADQLQLRARAVGHPLGAPSQRNDLIIASLAIRHHAPLISHNYRDFINIDALDLRTMAPIRKRPPRVRFDPGQRHRWTNSRRSAPRSWPLHVQWNLPASAKFLEFLLRSGHEVL